MSTPAQTSACFNMAIIGAGRMGSALCRGFIMSGTMKAEDIYIADHNASKLTDFNKLGVKTTLDNQEAILSTDNIWIAVKPKDVPDVVKNIRNTSRSNRLIISVAAGIPISYFSKELSSDKIIRVMPNVPLVVQAGVSVFAVDSKTEEKDKALLRTLLEPLGLCEEVSEKLIDPICGVSGCGPAYGYMMINALSDGGVRMGIPRDLAVKLAAQTLLGASKMVLADLNVHPLALKDQICSPAGTTIRGVHELEKAGFNAGVMSAVQAGAERAMEIGKAMSS